MTQNIERAEPTRDKSSKAGPVAHAIVHGCDWNISEYICDAGPGDPSFEERHEFFTIAAVIEGSFRYRADTGTSLMHPGAFLLGNFGSCFECGHDHSRGDRCVAFQFTPDYFAEVAASAGSTAQFKFRTGMLPSGPVSLSSLARIQSLIAQGDALAIGESVAELMELVVAASSGSVPSPQRISAGDERRISATLHLLERQFSEAIDLDHLAEVTIMSKYHFLRTFRRIVSAPLEPVHCTPKAASSAGSPDRPSLHLREQNSSMKNRKWETCTSGTVRDEDGNILIYSARSAIRC
jgi:AraC family transcriptional regulator